ncbi:MAG: hypothetical protein G01um10143_510 [Parcubacteria group bacterium Gr01-1014_3]|nr:MAG: hypothetical protein G01um10143_510 [Parcubacteria group bacterium Gr01-1014_3]
MKKYLISAVSVLLMGSPVAMAHNGVADDHEEELMAEANAVGVVVETLSAETDVKTIPLQGAGSAVAVDGRVDVQPAGDRKAYEAFDPNEPAVKKVFVVPHVLERVMVNIENPTAKAKIEAVIKKISEKDENISAAEVSETEVKVEYRRPAKLFGFIKVNYGHLVSLDRTGKLTGKKPWWLAFAKDDADTFISEMKYIFQNNQTNLDFLKIKDLIDSQAKAFETLSNAMKTRHEAMMNSIRNIK